MFCTDISAPFFLIFSKTVPHLLYYSHIPATIIALLLGLFVYYNNKDKNSLVSKLLLFISLTFFLWSIFDLILWTSIDSRQILLVWSLINLLEMLVTSSTLYFSYVFLEKKDAPLKYKIVVGSLLTIFTALIPTSLNISSFDLLNCEAIQGPLIYYFYFLEILFFLWLLIYLIKKIITSKAEEKKMTIYFSVGAVLFLSSFSGANIVGSLTEHWEILQYGLFGMPVFMAFLVYLIIKYKAFNIKLLVAQALVISIIILIASQFAFIQNPINKILTAITLLIVSAFGWWLIRSVKAEVQQREELAKLNFNLSNLLKQREALVHLVTHKVKGSFTRSKYIFAELLEGTFGPISAKVKSIVIQGLDSDNEGIATVDLVLNASSLRSDRVKYDIKLADFKKIVEEVINHKKSLADQKGLKLKTDIKTGNYQLLGDGFWLKEVARNLIDNALKYTLKGGVVVGLENKKDKILLSVKDTGIGLTAEDKANLFKEGGRGKDAVRINVDSTGYGLYTVKMIVLAHKGRVWQESEVGKGSTFFVELPLTQK